MTSQWSIKESFTVGVGKTYLLTERGLTVGRDPKSDIVVHSKSVDLNHAVIEWDRIRQQFSIRDLNTVNGTYVNQFPLRGTFKLLEQRDSIRFGYCTEQVFRVDLTVSPIVSTISTQTTGPPFQVVGGAPLPSLATTTLQYVPSSVVVPTSAGATITQTVIPQVISVVSLPETNSVVTVDKTIQAEGPPAVEDEGKRNRNSRSISGLGSPLYGCPSWWGEEEEEKERERAGSDSEIKQSLKYHKEDDKESFRPRSSRLLSPVSSSLQSTRQERTSPVQERSSSVDRELTNTSFTVEFDAPKRSKPNISRSSSLRVRPTSYTGPTDSLKEPPRNIRHSLTPPTSPQHKSTSSTKSRSSSVCNKPPISKTPLSPSHKPFTRGVRSATVVIRRDDKSKRGDESSKTMKKDTTEVTASKSKTDDRIKKDEKNRTTTTGQVLKKDERVKKRTTVVKKKKTEEAPPLSPPTTTNSKRDATYIVNDLDDKLDETTLVFTSPATTSQTSTVTNGGGSTHSTPCDHSRPTSARKQWNDNEVPHSLILSSIEARLKRLADTANTTALSVKQFIDQSKEGHITPNNALNSSFEIQSQMDLPQWKVVSKEYESICQYILASEESLKAIHESLGQFVMSAQEEIDFNIENSDAENVIIQSDSLEDSHTTTTSTEDGSNTSSSNPMLLVTAAEGNSSKEEDSSTKGEGEDGEELDRTGSELYYSISSETEDN